MNPNPNRVSNIESSAELKEAALKEVTEDPRVDQKRSKVYSFDFDYTDPRGKRWNGQFTNKILTIGERQVAAGIASRQLQGVSRASIDPGMLLITDAVAHMTMSLDDKKPTWADDLRAFDDEEILMLLWEEVASHEATFRSVAADSAGS